MTGRRIALYGQQSAVVEGFEVPSSLAADELLLEIHCSLISPGTELGGYNAPKRDQPSHLGYTAVGCVLAVGAERDATLADQLVYVFPARDDCSHCHASHKVVRPGGLVLPVPDTLDPRAACFARMVNIALTPFRNADPKIAGTVFVIGLGLGGNMVGQVGRILGFQTVGADLNAARRQRATAAGFDAVLDPTDGDPAKAIKQLTDGRGAELTVNATGRTEAFLLAVDVAATGGEISTLGGAKTSATADLQDVFGQIHSRHLTLRGGWEMLLPMRSAPAAKVVSTETNLRDAFRWLTAGALRLAPVWTHTIPPEQFRETYDALNRLDDDYLGVVVDWRSQGRGPAQRV
ncbi:MAG: hypothetical protein CO096_33045 [Armatimonadetes bacterium CG_4_9_14_3_um_filter_66_14]|nr:MAG: hypothetical protein CO096_33045 [Armatimonadetes bacterium CG_4_9_14_3_um_filter_66_14]